MHTIRHFLGLRRHIELGGKLVQADSRSGGKLGIQLGWNVRVFIDAPCPTFRTEMT